MESLVLNIEGMHCPKCEARVEKAAAAVPGVSFAQADHKDDALLIKYDGEQSTLDSVKDAICALEDFALID